MTSRRLHLFEGYGIELEYMIVDRDTLRVKPITDELLKKVLGSYGSDYENGIVTWSNELVLHVVELKSTRPESNLKDLNIGFTQQIGIINGLLEEWNAMLLPGAAHPLMDPLKETKLWPHDNNDVYAVYNRIFNCQGHGWSNLQSTHLNLPFGDDAEFGRLHAAIRMLLPLLPALCASSPVLDGKASGVLDTRLLYYKSNQSAIPSITGEVIPEPIFSFEEYQKKIYQQIESDIAAHDPEKILDPVWVNSRGAMARFDRGSIEIRTMDVQECPSADLAIVTLVVETLKMLIAEKFLPFTQQKQFTTASLLPDFNNVIAKGRHAQIENQKYLESWGLTKPGTALDVWQHILSIHLASAESPVHAWKSFLEIILLKGNLSERILESLNGNFSNEKITNTYRQLADCLSENKMFIS